MYYNNLKGGDLYNKNIVGCRVAKTSIISSTAISLNSTSHMANACAVEWITADSSALRQNKALIIVTPQRYEMHPSNFGLIQKVRKSAIFTQSVNTDQILPVIWFTVIGVCVTMAHILSCLLAHK
jgi:hypothetical protein